VNTPANSIEAKRLANVRARLALAGVELQQVGSLYRLRRWNLTRELASLDAVEVFAATLRTGGSR
jgi:hypothetical protein